MGNATRNDTEVMKYTGFSFLLACTIGMLLACNQESPQADKSPSDTADAPSDQEAMGPEPKIPITTPDGEPARYAFRSGVIEMAYKGDYNGVRRTSFTDFGARERKFDSAAPGGDAPLLPFYQLAIITPIMHGIIDFRTDEGQKMPNNAYQKYKEAWRRSSNKALGEIVLEHSNGQRLPDTMLMGNYRCRVYQQQAETFTRTIWVWGGVPIRESMQTFDNQSGSYTVEPVSITTDISLPDSLFTFPEGYTIKEIPYTGG